MWEDPIVAEVHRIREQLAAECGYDIEKYFAGVRERQAALGDLLIPAPKKHEQTLDADLGHAASPVEPAPAKSAPAA